MIRIGPAGWSYKDWEGIVYPPNPPSAPCMRFFIGVIDYDWFRSHASRSDGGRGQLLEAVAGGSSKDPDLGELWSGGLSPLGSGTRHREDRVDAGRAVSAVTQPCIFRFLRRPVPSGYISAQRG